MRLHLCFVEYEQSSIGVQLDWLAHTRLARSNLAKLYTRIENVHEARKKTCNFLLSIEVQQPFSFRFSLLRHYQMPECFYVKKCCF